MLRQPSGSPASRASSPSRSRDSALTSGGFTTTVLPAASAGASPIPPRSMGELKAGMTPTTPYGIRCVKTVMLARSCGIVRPSVWYARLA